MPSKDGLRKVTTLTAALHTPSFSVIMASKAGQAMPTDMNPMNVFMPAGFQAVCEYGVGRVVGAACADVSTAGGVVCVGGGGGGGSSCWWGLPALTGGWLQTRA